MFFFLLVFYKEKTDTLFDDLFFFLLNKYFWNNTETVSKQLIFIFNFLEKWMIAYLTMYNLFLDNKHLKYNKYWKELSYQGLFSRFNEWYFVVENDKNVFDDIYVLMLCVKWFQGISEKHLIANWCDNHTLDIALESFHFSYIVVHVYYFFYLVFPFSK